MSPLTGWDRRRWVLWLMVVQAASLVVMATLHVTHTLTGLDGAAIPEAVIGVVLLAGAWSLSTGRRGIAIASLILAIAGFVEGLTFTLPSGRPIDIAYHSTVLPLLVATLVLLVRSGRDGLSGQTTGRRRNEPELRSHRLDAQLH